MPDRPEDIIAARQQAAERKEWAELAAQAQVYAEAIRKVTPFAAENIKRHNYPSDPGRLAKGHDLVMMRLGQGPERAAWGRSHGFVVDPEGRLYSRRSSQTSAGSSSWWTEERSITEPFPKGLQEMRNRTHHLFSQLYFLHGVATSLMARTAHPRGECEELCVDCRLAREYRHRHIQIPKGYPWDEIDAIMNPDKKPVKKGFWARLFDS